MNAVKRFASACHSIAASLLVIYLAAAPALAHETDPFSCPPDDTPLADLGPFVGRWVYRNLAAGVRRANAEIAAADADGDAPRLHVMRGPDELVRCVSGQFPGGLTAIDQFEAVLRSPVLAARYPGQLVGYKPLGDDVYAGAFAPLDIRVFSHLVMSSTVDLFGHYVGTDKLGHFTGIGIAYYWTFVKAERAGATREQAIAAAVAFGTDGPESEAGLLGTTGTADYSNGDLAANFSGFLFFRNLTAPVAVAGIERPPLVVSDGLGWRLNDDVRPDGLFFAPFVSDHWDEALNPGVFDPYMRPRLRANIAARMGGLAKRYANPAGSPAGPALFVGKLVELRTYWGVDYGHRGDGDVLASIPNSCFTPAEVYAAAHQFALPATPVSVAIDRTTRTVILGQLVAHNTGAR